MYMKHFLQVNLPSIIHMKTFMLLGETQHSNKLSKKEGKTSLLKSIKHNPIATDKYIMSARYMTSFFENVIAMMPVNSLGLGYPGDTYNRRRREKLCWHDGNNIVGKMINPYLNSISEVPVNIPLVRKYPGIKRSLSYELTQNTSFKKLQDSFSRKEQH